MFGFFRNKNKEYSFTETLCGDREVIMSVIEVQGLLSTPNSSENDTESELETLKLEGLFLITDKDYSDTGKYFKATIYDAKKSEITKNVYITPKVKGNRFYCSFDSKGKTNHNSEVDVIVFER